MSEGNKGRVNPLTFAELPRAGIEFSALLAASPWLAFAPRPQGDDAGRPVLVLPGFGADDGSTAVLRAYLRFLGYEALAWEMGVNTGIRRFDGHARLVAKVIRHFQHSGRQVGLVGWSLGGLHARAVAREVPHAVHALISLGSPIQGRLGSTAVAQAFRRMRGAELGLPLAEGLVKMLRTPPAKVPCTAIASRTDGVVPWAAAQEADGPKCETIEVVSSHIGLGFHPAVFYAVADRLAQPSAKWRPFAPSALIRWAYPSIVSGDRSR